MDSSGRTEVAVTVNGQLATAEVEGRTLLCDLLRNHLGLTGTHLGCEHGYCGACTVLIDGVSTRSCLTLAAQVDGASVQTVEGLATTDGSLSPLQQAFKNCHGLQCGFCTPGLLMGVTELLAERQGTNGDTLPSRDEIREHLAGHHCRCTGYHQIVDAVQEALHQASDEALRANGATRG